MAGPQTYADRLGAHIDAYLSLVGECPDVRLEEFAALTRYAAVADHTAIVEVPAEGPVLERLLPHARITRAELVAARPPAYGEEILLTDWGMANLPAAHYDALLALAPLHHADAAQKRAYVAGAHRVLRPGGIFAFGEVEQGSPVATFLDGYVNEHSPVGHRGAFLEASFTDEIAAAGFTDVSTQRIDFHWVFPDRGMLETYLTRLFRLRQQPAGALAADVERLLGIDDDGRSLRLRWALRYFRGAKP